MNLSRRSELILRIFFAYLLVLSSFIDLCASCGPGRGNNRRRNYRKLRPLVFKQHVPNVSEHSLGASGLSEGRITRDDSRFKKLVPNYNPEIVFKDEEGTGADRLMSQRCKEKLNTLAISVMNQWPGVRLRVTESWDEDDVHSQRSLHYEGRAVDLTTSDRDRSKYGMLARLAVEAGFDWVFYESRSHVHASVKSESSHAIKSLGCFTGDSIIVTEQGTKTISELEVGEKVLSMTEDGQLSFSEVLLFMHRDPHSRAHFIRISTASGAKITLTPSHLILRWQKPQISSVHSEAKAVYAANVKLGEQVLIRNSNDKLWSSDEYNHPFVLDTITAIEHIVDVGVYAPLTMTGIIVVNDVVASCYAVINSQRLAHLAFAPLRLLKNLQTSLHRILQIMLHPSLLMKESPQTPKNTTLPVILNTTTNTIKYKSATSNIIVANGNNNPKNCLHSHISNNNNNNNNNVSINNDCNNKNNKEVMKQTEDIVINDGEINNKTTNHHLRHIKEEPNGIHWYCRMLEFISEFVIPHSWMMFQ